MKLDLFPQEGWRAFGISSADRSTLIASPAFDASAWEIWPYLTAGASLFIPGEEVRSSPIELRDWLIARGITMSFLPTPLAENVLALDWPVPVALRALLTGGDTLRSYPSADLPFALVNNYGPTENTVVTTSGGVPVEGRAGTLPSIGEPLAYTQVYLLDASLQFVPSGVPGELCIGGSGLARGYLHQADLTAEKFLPDPFSQKPGSRLYRTGDLARYTTDGRLEFLGRIDQQVKLRGYRIELGEIEAILKTHLLVKDALVLLRGEHAEEKYLVAYIIAHSAENLASADLRTFLESKLPAYMIPVSFLFLEQFPLTSNGKVDRQALPAPQTSMFVNSQSFVEPRTTVEKAVSEIWCKVLGIQHTSIYDNFFELGGHSLLAARLLHQMKKKFDKNIPLSALFRGPTVAHLAEIVQELHRTSRWSPLVRLQGGSKPPFFCIHPIGGNVHCYTDLARQLGSERPFYGLQAVDNEQEPYTTIEEMAAHYITAIQTVQATGPYLLGGWSMGGVIAFEMTQQLRAQGQEISLLALFDSWIALPGALTDEAGTRQ